MSDCPRQVTAPAPPSPTAGPSSSSTAGGATPHEPRFQLLDATLDLSQLPPALDPQESPLDLPLDTTHPRIQAYWADIKRRIQVYWTYPSQARREGQAGEGVVVLRVTRDGRLARLDIVQSTGAATLDRYMVNAIRLAAPFAPLPCKITEVAIPIVMSFGYVLQGLPDPRRQDGTSP